MAKLKFLLIFCAFACGPAKSQPGAYTVQDSAAKTAFRIEQMLSRFGLNYSLYSRQAIPEYYLITCFTDSKGNLEHVELFSTDSAAHKQHFQTRVLPQIDKVWQPIESKYVGIIIPVFLMNGSSDEKKFEQYAEICGFFSRIQRNDLNKSKMFLARAVLLAY